MNFKNWLLTENTISQILKQKYKDKYKKIYNAINAFVKSNINNLSDESVLSLTKWYAFNYFRYLTDRNIEESGDTYRSFFYLGGEPILIGHKDYLTTKIDENGDFDSVLKSRLNDPDFSIQNLERLIEFWHTSLESKKRTPGAEGKTLIDLSKPIAPKNLTLLTPEWKGYKWVDLERGYCDIESKSMGHCGNSGAKNDDTILSLRDENNIPHLTFILNNGILGEMKGRNNNKPSEKYYPAIVELLKHPIIKQVRGGGYKPENNFKLLDLDDEIRDKLIELKPDLEFDIYEHMEKEMQEAREEYDVENWKFASEYSDVEEVDGNPYIYMSGSFKTTLKVKMLKGIPGYSVSQYEELRNLKRSIIDEVRRYFYIEDIEFEEDKNALTIMGGISRDDYGGDEINNFKDFLHHLANEVEPYEQEVKNIVQRILVEKGYIAPYYVYQATKETGKLGWSNFKFKNLKWEEAQSALGDHSISVEVFDRLNLGRIENKEKKDLHPVDRNFLADLVHRWQKKLEKSLEDELEKISNEFGQRDKQQYNLFQKNKDPYYTQDMKIRPDLSVRITAERKDYSEPWDPDRNPVLSFSVNLNASLEISQMNSWQESKQAERMLHFIDNNFDYIKQRLIKRFEKESLLKGEKVI